MEIWGISLWGLSLGQLLERGGILLGFLTARYLIFAGIAFLLVWVVFARRTARLRIQAKPPSRKRMWAEFGWSMSTMVIFALIGVGVFIAKQNGYTQVYTKVADRGWLYFFASIVGLILWHDFYFYVTHRLMHHRLIFKHVHHVHHRSTNPSPWASFAFHPYEAVIEAGVVPIAVFLVPLHPLAVLVFLLYMTAMNVLGHLGFELFPRGFASNPKTRWHNTTVHHNLHHEKVHCNYSLYFNWWDRIFGTMYKDYEKVYDAVKEGRRSAPTGAAAFSHSRDIALSESAGRFHSTGPVARPS